MFAALANIFNVFCNAIPLCLFLLMPFNANWPFSRALGVFCVGCGQSFMRFFVSLHAKMINMENETDYRLLLQAVEQDMHRSFTAPSDFKWLSQKIEQRTKEHLSATTLMRLWGYVPGGTPRKVTLDIVARGIGYMGFDDFIQRQSPLSPEANAEEKSEAWETISHPAEATGKRHGGLWWGIAIVAACLVGVLLWKWLAQPPKPVYVTDLTQLSNAKQYLIHTKHGKRGSLGVAGRHLATTYTQAAKNRCEEASPFAIIQYEGSYYLYSVKDRSFIEVGIQEHDAPLAKEGVSDCALDIHQEADSCFVIDFKCCKTVCSLNVNSAYGPMVTDYGTVNSMFDEGNLFMLEEAGDFDPTEALAMMQEPNPEYTAALKAVTPGRSAIYTEASDSSRYYLRADGYLTETLTDSCLFDIQLVEKKEEETVPYRLPAWRIVWQTKAPQDGDAAGTTFSCPYLEADRYVPSIGHLRVDAATGRSWQNKVLFLGTGGCYAIRATNVSFVGWGAGLYWTVCDLNGDGQPEADYSEERAYVWQLKKL